MCEERVRIRCAQCELVQWADHANCRRCSKPLPVPIVNVVERAVERVVNRRKPLRRFTLFLSALRAR